MNERHEHVHRAARRSKRWSSNDDDVYVLWDMTRIDVDDITGDLVINAGDVFATIENVFPSHNVSIQFDDGIVCLDIDVWDRRRKDVL